MILSKYEAEFHYPSLLILLEEEAVNRDLLTEIHHSNIKSTSHMITEEIEDIDDEEAEESEKSRRGRRDTTFFSKRS